MTVWILTGFLALLTFFALRFDWTSLTMSRLIRAGMHTQAIDLGLAKGKRRSSAVNFKLMAAFYFSGKVHRARDICSQLESQELSLSQQNQLEEWQIKLDND